ncbi:MAG TPA: hypothetical protein VJN18_13980 [Polyangiaceae bacterium]|nr:hypothetical protein [Polyangiaceae bacterium]
MTAIRIDPRFNIPYYSLYLDGLVRMFGRGSLRFDHGGMPAETEFDDGFAFVVQRGRATSKREYRVYVSANDFSRYDRLALAWCDRYGIVNLDPNEPVPGDAGKVIPLGPSFGVQRWGKSLLGTYRDVVELMSRAGYPAAVNLHRLRSMRRYFFERVPEPELCPGASSDDYVFYVAWPWKKHAEVNPPRARFMRACKAMRGVQFEGGFVPRRHNDVSGIDDITAERVYPFRSWLERTRRSALVFNCAAVHGCLGWKLGEFLALGKATLSVPLQRRMPAELAHGEHVHLVQDSPEAIGEGVARLLGDAAYRKRLETGARAYYLRYLAPESVVSRLVETGENR